MIDCSAGKIDMIVTKSISRFARNTVDAISAVRKLAQLKHPVGVLFETEKYLSRVLSLYVIWNIIYLPITIFGFKENNMSFARYVLDCIRGFLFIGQQFYSWQLWYLLSVFFVIASICIMAEHKIKDKNIFKIMMAIFLMGGV